jgi:hypothetical protein
VVLVKCTGPWLGLPLWAHSSAACSSDMSSQDRDRVAQVGCAGGCCWVLGECLLEVQDLDQQAGQVPGSE